MISFTLDIEPQAWERVKRGARGQAYVPGKTRRFERDLGTLAKSLYRGAPLSGPLNLSLVFHLVPPKRPKFKLPAVRPDLDNYVKSVKDGLSGVLWQDDAQVVELIARKLYDWTARRGRIEVRIEEVA